MAKYDVCKGGGVGENQTNADKGGGGQKTRKFCRHHLSMAPYTMMLTLELCLPAMDHEVGFVNVNCQIELLKRKLEPEEQNRFSEITYQ